VNYRRLDQAAHRGLTNVGGDPYSVATMERPFPRDVNQLGEVFDFVTDCFQTLGVDESHRMDVDLIIEELFTNLVKYNAEGTQDIVIGLERKDAMLAIELTDFDVHEFDITKAPPVDTNAPLSERTPGGLGIHLVTQIADHVFYEYDNGISRIKVHKRIGP
jgi:anti-sigma regulatory factor (Ser/Thr protein kinase)